MIIFGAKYLFVAVILIVAYVWLRQSKRRKLEMALAVILAGTIAFVASRIAGKLYYDPRPFLTHNVKPLVPYSGDNGFPSDHSLLSMTLAAAAYFYSRKWSLAAGAIAVIVGVSRVLAHVHSPVDILGAWAISIVAAAVAYGLLKRPAIVERLKDYTRRRSNSSL